MALVFFLSLSFPFLFFSLGYIFVWVCEERKSLCRCVSGTKKMMRWIIASSNLIKWNINSWWNGNLIVFRTKLIFFFQMDKWWRLFVWGRKCSRSGIQIKIGYKSDIGLQVSSASAFILMWLICLLCLFVCFIRDFSWSSMIDWPTKHLSWLTKIPLSPTN